MKSILCMLNKVDASNRENFYKKISKALENHKKMFIVTANPEIIMNGRNSSRMYEILMKKADVIADGIGVSKSVQLLKKKEVERNTGIQLVEFLLDEANSKGYKVFIYGARQEVLEDLEVSCKKRWPQLSFSGIYNGYTNKAEDVLKRIEEKDSDIYLVALGSPKQELFIDDFFDKINTGICVGVGGSFDVLSGQVKRAPQFFLKHNLEWLYRISTQPKRLKRFIKGNVAFVFVFAIEYICSFFKGKKL